MNLKIENACKEYIPFSVVNIGALKGIFIGYCEQIG